MSWTEAAYNEYRTASAMADLLGALLAARAPVDLIGMASDFVADEILHVELTSRIAMELGGGAPYEVDFAAGHASIVMHDQMSPSPRARFGLCANHSTTNRDTNVALKCERVYQIAPRGPKTSGGRPTRPK